jgi:hypothetical protein
MKACRPNIRACLTLLAVYMAGNKIPKYVATKLKRHIWARMGGSMNNGRHTDDRGMEKQNKNI